jgi:hypothetical protein
MNDLAPALFIDPKATEGETQVWRKSFHKFCIIEATTMGKFLEAFFSGLVKTGSVEIEMADGHKLTLGDGFGPK